jgi:hypothetical protein
MGPDGSLRPFVVSTVIGLLYSTGLRIGEALKLTLADVDIQGELLTIRETKFNKSRYVPLSPSTVQHLADFMYQREVAGFSTIPTAPVFINASGNAYRREMICALFLVIIRNLGIRGPKGVRGPRVHDFRHTFAVNRLAQWYRQDDNINAKLPLLATYLGHTTLIGTETYLHATAELLEYRAADGVRCAIFRIPFMFVIIAGNAEILLKVNLHPLTEVHQIREHVLDVVFVAIEIPAFKGQAVGLHDRVDSVGTLLIGRFVPIYVVCHGLSPYGERRRTTPGRDCLSPLRLMVDVVYARFCMGAGLRT